MKVISLLGSDFTESCRLLARKVSEDYEPDAVIGILRGGGYVGREVFRFLPHREGVQYAEVRIQRPNAGARGRGVMRRVLGCSPTFLLDWMRMLESAVLERKAGRNAPRRVGSASLPREVDRFLGSGPKKVLLIDDAIDSGATLHMMKGHLESRYAGITVRIAVVTVTLPDPMVDADYFLFHDRTLVRFPWSYDVRRRR